MEVLNFEPLGRRNRELRLCAIGVPFALMTQYNKVDDYLIMLFLSQNMHY